MGAVTGQSQEWDEQGMWELGTESCVVSAAAADLSQLRELRDSFPKGWDTAGFVLRVDYLIPLRASLQCFLCT